MFSLKKAIESWQIKNDARRGCRKFNPNGKWYLIVGCPDDFFKKFRLRERIKFYLKPGYSDVDACIEGYIDVVSAVSSYENGEQEQYSFMGRFRLRRDGGTSKEVFGKINLSRNTGWLTVRVSDSKM